MASALEQAHTLCRDLQAPMTLEQVREWLRLLTIAAGEAGPLPRGWLRRAEYNLAFAESHLRRGDTADAIQHLLSVAAHLNENWSSSQ